jgi:hypothetical protein
LFSKIQAKDFTIGARIPEDVICLAEKAWNATRATI